MTKMAAQAPGFSRGECQRHRYVIADCHGQHGKFKRLMSKLARRELGREFRKDMDGAPKKSKWMWFYFD